VDWAKQRFAPVFEEEALEAGQPRDVLLRAGRELMRHELTQLERFVLLQIYDQTWKDHMYAMDLLKSGIWTQAYAERDPKIAFKREGFRLFEEMLGTIREKVTDIIFKVRLASEEGPRRGPRRAMMARHDEAINAGFAAAQRDQAAAMAAQGQPPKPETIRRTMPKVGRNDPCPCGSGKKYKKCHGAASS
jgi:preprotein translocase subunit SecA